MYISVLTDGGDFTRSCNLNSPVKHKREIFLRSNFWVTPDFIADPHPYYSLIFLALKREDILQLIHTINVFPEYLSPNIYLKLRKKTLTVHQFISNIFQTTWKNFHRFYINCLRSYILITCSNKMRKVLLVLLD